MEAECSDSGAVEYPMILVSAMSHNIRRYYAREVARQRRGRVSDDSDVP